MVHYPFDKKSWDISNSPNPCWARHVQNLCSCYFFTKLNLVLAMFCSLPLMHSIHYVSCCITKSRICKTHLLKLCQGYSKIIWILDWATHVFTICMSDQPQRRQSSSSRIKYFTAKVLKYSSTYPFYDYIFPIRGVLLYFMVLDHKSVSIHSLLNLTQRGCLYLLYPNNADHAIEQCNQFVQQELVFHYLVHKIKQLQCLFSSLLSQSQYKNKNYYWQWW